MPLGVGSVSSMPPRESPDAELARAVRTLREQRGLTQEGLAHEAGLTFGSVSKIETARSNPAWTTVRHIAKALGVSMAELGRLVDSGAEKLKG
jgi:transcriptional regulator with XRE-family HTH domain